MPCVNYQLIKAGYQTCTNFSMLTSDALDITARVRITRRSCELLRSSPERVIGSLTRYILRVHVQPTTTLNSRQPDRHIRHVLQKVYVGFVREQSKSWASIGVLKKGKEEIGTARQEKSRKVVTLTRTRK